MTNIIHTSAPIPIEELKQYFTDKDTFYQIDEKTSSLHSTKLLTYLSNLDLPCDITLSDSSSLLADYFSAPVIVNIPSLEQRAIDMLLQYKGINEIRDAQFIEENRDILKQWTRVLDSLTLFNMFMVNAGVFKEFAMSHEHDDTSSIVGINFVSVLKHVNFYSFYEMIDQDNLKFYTKYFQEPMFKGKSLFEYWANGNNPLFLLTHSIANSANAE